MPQLNSRFFLNILIFFLSSVFIFSCSNEEPQTKPEIIRPAKITTVGNPLVGTQRVYPGEVEGGDRSEQAFRRVSGQLVKLPARAGMRAKMGSF